MLKKLLLISFSLIFLVSLALLYFIRTNYIYERQVIKKIKNSPRIEKTHFDYRIVLVGDSLTEYLGNLEELEYFLNKYYPNKNFLLLNYGYSATNILSLPERVEKDSTHSGRIFQAINDIPFDLVLIESFGNNPLSEYPLEEGLKKQEEALDKTIKLLLQKHPKESIVFVATISPNKKNYAKTAVDLSPEKRAEWANERIAYIENHIKYARSHGYPVINVFEESKDIFGDGNMRFINKVDYIHPSTVGIYFIDEQIAKFIYQNKLLK